MAKERTRREFLWIHGRALQGGDKWLGHDRTDLRSYSRVADPMAEVSYPNHWYVVERLLTNLVDPVQVFSLSSRRVEAHDAGIGGLPNLSRVASDCILLTIYARPLTAAPIPTVARRTSDGIRMEDLAVSRNSAFPQFQHRIGWYSGSQWSYQVMMWIGSAARDLQIAGAVVRSLVLP